MRTYTLVAYKPSGSSANCGRGCCGYTHRDSDFELQRGLTLEQLAEQIAKYKISYVEGHREEYNGEPWDLKWFNDTGTSDWEWNDARDDYYEADGFYEVDKQLTALVDQQEPIIRQRQEKAEREAKELREKEEQARRVKAEAEAKERRDREEYDRLQKKFGAK